MLGAPAKILRESEAKRSHRQLQVGKSSFRVEIYGLGFRVRNLTMPGLLVWD